MSRRRSDGWVAEQLVTARTGEGLQVLAAGLPEQVLADGARLGWVARDRLWLWQPGGLVILASGRPVEDAQSGRAAWVLVGDEAIWRGNPETGDGHRLDLDPDVVDVRAGVDWVVLRDSDGIARVVAAPGAPPPSAVPGDAIHEPTLAPWGEGPGLVWAAGERLLRLEAGGRPQVLGEVPGLVGFVVGPQGVVVAVGQHVAVAAPGALLVPLEADIEPETVRFSPDGERLLALGAEGAVEVDLARGRVRRRFGDRVVPVGYGPDPLFLDEEGGRVLDADGRVLQEGLLGAVPGRRGSLLAGPGGTLWSLAEGRRVWTGAPLDGGCVAAGDEAVAWYSEEGLALFDLEGNAAGRWPDPLAEVAEDEEDDVPERWPEAVRWLAPDRLVVADSEGAVAVLDVGTGGTAARLEVDADELDLHWPLLVDVASGVLVRDGAAGVLLPEGTVLDPGEDEVLAVASSGGALYRLLGAGVDAVALPEGGVLWAVGGVEGRSIAAGRWVYVAEGDDLLVVDPARGDARDRFAGVLAGCERLVGLEDRVAGLPGDDDVSGVVLVNGRTGAEEAVVPLPADDVARMVDGGGQAWLWGWTLEGLLWRARTGG